MDHETAFELLPWYVNGTLSDDERALVESHVNNCVTCRIEERKERGLRELVRSTETLSLSAEAGFARLDRALNEDSQASVSSRRTLSSFRPLTRIAASIALIMVAAFIISTQLPRAGNDSPEYVTLTGGSAGNASGNHLDIVFAAHVTEPEIRALLTDIGGSIVSGPSQIGRYTISLDEVPTTDEVAAFVQSINADDRVEFASMTLGPSALPELEASGEAR